jgi:hypothetical protein
MKKALFPILALVLALGLALPVAAADGPVQYIGEDWGTQGDWIGVYGHYAYILPKAPSAHVEYPIGAGTVMQTSPYYDYVGGNGWPVGYSISGPETPADVRALETPDETQRRATCYWGDSTITLTNLEEGSYQLGLYLLDWDSTSRGENVSVTVDDGTPATFNVTDFHGGKYVLFEVSGTTVTITLTKTAGANAVISGVFLDNLNTSITYPVVDDTTQGDWVGNYGELGYLLCAMDSIYTRNNAQPEDPAYDIKGGRLAGEGAYSVTNGNYWAWTDYYPAEGTTAPCYAWIWETPTEDVRACWYTESQVFEGYPTMEDAYEREAACWDSCTYPHFLVNLSVPEGEFYLSLYALDYDTTARSQTIEIFDSAGTLLAGPISVADFHNGVYEGFLVEGPIDLVIKVTKVSGANSVLSGIFLDQVLEPQEVGTISGIKFYDANLNGVFDEGEAGVGGITIFLDLNENGELDEGEPCTVTAEDGSYTFDGLAPGTYIVREILPEGCLTTTGVEQTVDVPGALAGAEVTAPLIAGQHYDVGTLDIVFDPTDDEDKGTLTVTYNITTEDCYLTETHLYVGTEPPLSAPGQYPFKHEGLSSSTDTYTITLDDLELDEWPASLYIAAHAVVYCESWPDNGAGTETAWALPEGYTPFGQGWGGYFSYSPAISGAAEVTDVNFGNVCLGAGGGKTIGFWGNKNGQGILSDNWTTIEDSGVLADEILAGLPNTNLEAPYLANAGEVKVFLRNADAVDMQYMLAAQWLGMEFNVLVGDVESESLVYLGDLDGDGIADADEFMSVDEVLTKVSDEWETWDRATQEYWKDILDDANNNQNFLLPEP